MDSLALKSNAGKSNLNVGASLAQFGDAIIKKRNEMFGFKGEQ